MIMSENLKLTFVSVLLLASHNTFADEACTTVPSCEELGYSETNCDGLPALKCPFDKTKLFCGFYTAGDVIKENGTVRGMAVNYHLAVAMNEESPTYWPGAIAACEAKTTGEKSWRLPNQDELIEIYNKIELLNSRLEANGGSKIASSGHWSSTESKGSNYAWGVAMVNGFTDLVRKDTKAKVRCVFDL